MAMHTMFFERPVAAARPARKVGVHARSIGEENTNSRSRVACYFTDTRTFIPVICDEPFVSISNDGGGSPIIRCVRVCVCIYVCVCAREWLPAWRGTLPIVAGAAAAAVVVVTTVVPARRSVRARSAARSCVTSVIPPHVVNTKHGRRTDIRWSSASQTEGVNWPQYGLPRTAAMRR